MKRIQNTNIETYQQTKYSLKNKHQTNIQTINSRCTTSSSLLTSKISIKNMTDLKKSRCQDIYFETNFFLNIKYDNIRANKFQGQLNEDKKTSFYSYTYPIQQKLKKLLCATNLNNPEDNTTGCQCYRKERHQYVVSQNGCVWIKKFFSKQHLLNITTNHKYFNQNTCKDFIQIEKDIERTQSDLNFFKSKTNLQNLKNVLVYYSNIDMQVGYVQGINIIASIFIYHAKSIRQTIQMMSLLFKKCNYRQVYLKDFQYAKIHAIKIVKCLQKKSNEIYLKLKSYNINLQIFVMGWLFSMMGEFINFQYMHLVIDLFISKGWKGMYQLIITFIIYLGKNILKSSDQFDTMSILSTQNLRETVINWKEIIEASQSIPIKENEIFQF